MLTQLIELYRQFSYEKGWCLSIYHSTILDWTIQVTDSKQPNMAPILDVQDCDLDYAAAAAYQALADWLREHHGGY